MIRVNSQSGKGVIGLHHEGRPRAGLPRRLQIEFSPPSRRSPTVRAARSPPRRCGTCSNEEYLAPISAAGADPPAGDRGRGGRRHRRHHRGGEGRRQGTRDRRRPGTAAGRVCRRRDDRLSTSAVLDYSEHAMSSGDEARPPPTWKRRSAARPCGARGSRRRSRRRRCVRWFPRSIAPPGTDTRPPA